MRPVYPDGPRTPPSAWHPPVRGVPHVGMKALAINCTLKKSPETSNTEALLRTVTERLEGDGVEVDVVRAVDLDIAPGVVSEAVHAGDAWPDVHAKLLASEILVVASPTWLGQPSSVAGGAPSGGGSWSGWTRCCPRRTTRGGRWPTTGWRGSSSPATRTARTM
ncbi:hypothetical protein GCM10017779_22620 [Streptomyces capillispiralis]|nr:hypothetical protein GCM10017779_22620 [Streptomyces capillispiralis]